MSATTQPTAPPTAEGPYFRSGRHGDTRPEYGMRTDGHIGRNLRVPAQVHRVRRGQGGAPLHRRDPQPSLHGRLRLGELDARVDAAQLLPSDVGDIRHRMVEVGRDPYDARIYTLMTAIVDETKEKAWAKHDDLERYADDEAALTLFSGWMGVDLSQYDLTPQQYEALIKLTATLCKTFPKIRCDYPRDGQDKLLPRKLADEDYNRYNGILGHYHVQLNKVDPGPAFQWQTFIDSTRALTK